MEPREYKALIHKVFSTQDGQEVLGAWQLLFVEPTTFDPDALELDRNAARKDFVTELQSIIREVATWDGTSPTNYRKTSAERQYSRRPRTQKQQQSV